MQLYALDQLEYCLLRSLFLNLYLGLLPVWTHINDINLVGLYAYY